MSSHFMLIPFIVHSDFLGTDEFREFVCLFVKFKKNLGVDIMSTPRLSWGIPGNVQLMTDIIFVSL